MNSLPFPIQIRVIAALVEGSSIRATGRMVGVHRDSVMRLGLRVGDGCARLHDTRVKSVHPSTLQLDEIWAYVRKKQGHLGADDPAEWGDQYTFVGLDADHKLAISYLVGKRTAETAKLFAADLRTRVLGKPQITTDGWKAYPDAIEAAFGTKVHYGVALKHYEDEEAPEEVRRYSPGRLVSVTKVPLLGSPDETSMSTAYVERGNLTMRMGMRRFTRLTNAFSKTVRGLQAAVSLHFAHYNWCRVHMTLRVTPAMSVGLTDHVWSIEELLSAIEALPKPTTPAPSAPAGPSGPIASRLPGGPAPTPAMRALPEPPDAASDFRWMW